VKDHRFVRRRGSHIFKRIDLQMVVKLSALRPAALLPLGRFLVFISVRGCVDPRDMVQLEGLGQLEIY
jgi:hypothetical protein